MKYFITKNENNGVEYITPAPPNTHLFDGDYLLLDELPSKKESEKYQLTNGKLLVVNKDESDLLIDEKEKRQLACKIIDAETRNAIAEGFQFDGKHFSLSQNAQLNWQMLGFLHQAGEFIDTTIPTITSESYLLTAANVLDFVKAVNTKIATELQLGITKKNKL